MLVTENDPDRRFFDFPKRSFPFTLMMILQLEKIRLSIKCGLEKYKISNKEEINLDC